MDTRVPQVLLEQLEPLGADQVGIDDVVDLVDDVLRLLLFLQFLVQVLYLDLRDGNVAPDPEASAIWMLLGFLQC